jgi:ABC-type sugar transport system ATPase subunit
MSTGAHVRLQGIVKRHGSFTALHNLDLEIAPGEFFALLGPSGSGKTTTLRILAGLDTPDSGQVHVDAADVTNFAPGARDVAMVFQSYALYPHMTVYDNIAFPLRMVSATKSEIDRSVRIAAAKVRIEPLLHRRPGQLSGGQQQRCALARAIVRRPRLFLLDEPLSNLDAKLRLETRIELKKLQRSLDVTAVYVTHDQEEAMALADRMAVFMDGRIVQVGSPEEVFFRPATVAVAGFLGNPPMNLMPARLVNGQATIEGAVVPMLSLAKLGTREITLGVRPSAIRIGGDGLPATVTMCETVGEDAIVDLSLGDLLVRAKTPTGDRPREGIAVSVSFDAADVHAFDRTTGVRLET